MAEQDLQIQIDELKRQFEELKRFKLHNHSGLNSDPIQLEFIDNVTIEAIASGEIIVFDGGRYVNKTLAEAGVPTELNDLTDVTLTSPVEGGVLINSSGTYIDGQSPRLLEILDSSGIPVLAFDDTANGIQYMKFFNDGSKPLLTGEGAANVSIYFKGAGSGTVHLGDAELQFPDIDAAEGKVMTSHNDGTLTLEDVPVVNKSNAVQMYAGGDDFFVLTQDVNRLSTSGVVTIDDFEITSNTSSAGDGFFVGDNKADVTKDFAYNIIVKGNTLAGTLGNVGFYTGISSSNGGPDNAGDFTDEHVGFIFSRVSGLNSKLWASNTVSSTQTKTEITGITLENFNVYRIERVSGSIFFYVNGTLEATHTTNLPTDSTMNIVICRRGALSGQFTLKNNWAYAEAL